MRRDALLCNAKVLHLLILTVLLCMSCDGQEASSSRGEAPLGQNVFGMPHHKSEQKEQLTRVSGQCFWTAQQHNMAKGQVTSLICCIGHDKSSNLLWAGASGQVQGIKVTCWCSDAGQRLGICTAAHEHQHALQIAMQCQIDEEHWSTSSGISRDELGQTSRRTTCWQECCRTFSKLGLWRGRAS